MLLQKKDTEQTFGQWPKQTFYLLSINIFSYRTLF